MPRSDGLNTATFHPWSETGVELLLLGVGVELLLLGVGMLGFEGKLMLP